MGRLGPRLLVPLVSLMAAVAGAGGEICHYWTEGAELPAGAFQCPELGDGVDATFCCGTCSMPYCCSTTEGRLKQDQCLAVGLLHASTYYHSYFFYIVIGLTVATLLGLTACLIYFKICQPLWARVRVQRQVYQQDLPASRVSFQDTSPTFVYGLGSRLRGPNLPNIYNAITAIPLSSRPPSCADMPAQASQTDSGLPGEEAANSPPPAALLNTAASGGTPGPEE